MKVVDLMKQSEKESFINALGLWFEKWKSFLNPDYALEKSVKFIG
jgi:hypothetical protein